VPIGVGRRSTHRPSFAIAAFAVPATFGFVFGIETEMEKSVVVRTCHQHNIAPRLRRRLRGLRAERISRAGTQDSHCRRRGLHEDFTSSMNNEFYCATGSGTWGWTLTNLPCAAVAEFNDAGDLGEQRVVLAAADVHAGFDFVPRWRTMIDPPGPTGLEGLDSQPLRIGVAPVLRTA